MASEISKQHILNEIERITKKVGKVPGRLLFTNETGIKTSDWRGKYWVRWNDAIRETGLEPNSKTEAYTEEYLLDRLIKLTEHLKSFPVESEMRMESRRDSSFPSSSTYTKKFGSKKELLLKVIEHCKKNGQLNNIIQFCEAALPCIPEDSVEMNSDEIQWSFVYLMKSGRYYKIGLSNSPGRREYEIKTQMPEKVEKIHEIKTDDPIGIEEYWHKRFKDKRKNGEWFDLNASDVATFKRRRLM